MRKEWDMAYLWWIIFLMTLCGLCDVPAVVRMYGIVMMDLSDETLWSVCCCQDVWHSYGGSFWWHFVVCVMFLLLSGEQCQLDSREIIPHLFALAGNKDCTVFIRNTFDDIQHNMPVLSLGWPTCSPACWLGPASTCYFSVDVVLLVSGQNYLTGFPRSLKVFESLGWWWSNA